MIYSDVQIKKRPMKLGGESLQLVELLGLARQYVILSSHFVSLSLTEQRPERLVGQEIKPYMELKLPRSTHLHIHIPIDSTPLPKPTNQAPKTH